MNIVMFYHSLISDWNHGNAHFLRGVASELLARGHDVRIYEPLDSWSVENLVRERGPAALTAYRGAYPQLASFRYNKKRLDLNRVLEDADLVIVHEWNDHDLVAAIGSHRRQRRRFKLLFHDTHHRCVSDRDAMARYDLRFYDGVLAFGEVIRQIYLGEGWTRRAWTWHEAADVPVFRPLDHTDKEGDLVWIGNWGDEERSAELIEFLVEPVRRLGLRARVYGVRYPAQAIRTLRDSGIEYGGWLANYRVPAVFSRFRLTVHVPRRPYARSLPGIPTIRPFEALACGIPLVCAPWRDSEGLFDAPRDMLFARDGEEMARTIKAVLDSSDRARELRAAGRQTILRRHTCAHRVDELLAVGLELGLTAGAATAEPALFRGRGAS